MNTRGKATQQIIDFINSDEKCSLLTGTFQNEKHPLVLNVLNELYKGSKILFRGVTVKLK